MFEICVFILCASLFLLFFSIGIMISARSDKIENPFDDTDSPTKRSGMIVFVDAKTNIQYLSCPKGGLTVRLDENDKPMRG